MNLRNNCLGFTALEEKQVQAIHDGAESVSHQTLLRTLGRVCLSHERLRAEIQGLEEMLRIMERKQSHGCTDATCKECDQ